MGTAGAPAGARPFHGAAWWRGSSRSAWPGTASRGSPAPSTTPAIPCPSAADPDRNTHRSGQAWTLTTVRAILANPRYTGRQVWNRQRTDHDLIDPANTGLGHRQVQRWNLPEGWVISARPAHPALVSEKDFIAVQGIRAARGSRIRLAATCWPGCCAAESAGGGWSPAGRTAGPPTGAGTATPARPGRTRPGPGTCTSARTISCPTCQPCSSSWLARGQPGTAQPSACHRRGRDRG